MGESHEDREHASQARSQSDERAPSAGERPSGASGVLALQKAAGNRATAGLMQRQGVQRHPLPTAESEWKPPEAPPGIWEWLTSLAGRLSGSGSGTATPPTTGGGAGGATTATPTTGGTSSGPTTGGTAPTTGGTAPETTTGGATTTAGTTTTTSGGSSGTTTSTGSGSGGTAAPTSLTSAGSYAAYATAAQTVKTNWSTYADADARGRALGGAAISALTAVNVHPPTVTMADLPAGNGGNFGFPTWTLTLARLPFAPATVTDDVFDNAYTAVYHESRHCEQWFRMARLRAGAGRTAAQIVTDMGIPAAPAAAAFANPIVAGSAEATEAQAWWDSVYGSGSANRGAVLTEVMAALNAYNSAKSADDAGSTPATQATLTAATTRFSTAYAAYEALPEEADAFATAGPARTALQAAAAATTGTGSGTGGGSGSGSATPTPPTPTPSTPTPTH